MGDTSRRAPADRPPALTPARRAKHAARDKRLADALRENLRRRKEQARAREDEADSVGRSETEKP